MKEVLLRELFRNTAEYADAEVLVKGWVRNNRNSNKFGFIELNDGSFFKSVQVVYEEEFLDNYEEIAKSYVGSALAVTGVVCLTPNAKQPFEIKAKAVTCRRNIDTGLSASAEAPLHGVPERNRLSAAENEYVQRGISCPLVGCLCDS